VADLNKTVGIVFESQDKVGPVVENIANSLSKLERQQQLSAAQALQSAAAEEKWAASAIKAQLEAEKLAADQEKLGIETQQAATKADTAADDFNRLSLVFKAIAGSIVVKEFLDANAAIEKLRLGFESVTGTSAAAARELEFVRDAADRLGVKTEEAGFAYLRLAAATKGSTLEGEGARAIFEAVTKQLVLLGGSSADVTGALIQVAQGISKGKFELEDLKSIAERMPGFFDKFAESLGKTTPELFKLIEQGKIGGPEFLKFANTVNAAIGSIDVDTYEAQTARLSNASKDLAVALGDAGLFNAATKSIEVLAGSIKGIPGLFEKFRDGAKEAWASLSAGEGTIKIIRESLAESEVGAQKFLGTFENGAESVNLFADEAAKYIEETAGGFNLFAGEAAKYIAATKEIDAAYKLLGINSEKVNADFIGAFEKIAAGATATGKVVLEAFSKALPKLEGGDDFVRAMEALNKAYENGTINATQHRKAAEDLGKALEKTVGPSDDVKKAFEAQQKEITRAKEAAEKYQLELEKLAANERIKLIEARVQLNVAQIEADTKRIEAAFDSINSVVGDTNELIGNLFGILADPNLEWAQIRAIEDQIAKENLIKQGQLELQRKLIEAQIMKLNAETANIIKGDALIKIDGAGLQPHLEGFMWEILRTIQMRANRDGRALLLGL
jgi:tape measure domain-containing protein